MEWIALAPPTCVDCGAPAPYGITGIATGAPGVIDLCAPHFEARVQALLPVARQLLEEPLAAIACCEPGCTNSVFVPASVLEGGATGWRCGGHEPRHLAICVFNEDAGDWSCGGGCPVRAAQAPLL